jgi:hypothetical protein
MATIADAIAVLTTNPEAKFLVPHTGHASCNVYGSTLGSWVESTHVATSRWSGTKASMNPRRGVGRPTKAASKESVMGQRSTIPTTDAEAASLTVSKSNQQTIAKHQSWPMVKPVLLAALVCAAPVRLSSAQEAKVSVDLMGIGSMSCAHWQSTLALRLEGTVWIYGFWTGLNYVAAASGQTETKVDTATAVVEVKKTCAQRPSQVLASAVWTAYLEFNKR